VSQLSVHAQRIDTLYYDNNWKGVETKEFATYVAYAAYAKSANFSNKFRIHYAATNELQSEGNFISIDKYDATKLVYDGEIKSYYKNGQTHEVTFFKNGIREGSYTRYFENGLINLKINYVNGKPEGIYYEFSEDGNSCSQLEYKEGEPVTPYFTYSTKDGLITKYKLKDHSLYLDMPTLNEVKVYLNNGNSWNYYLINGLCLMVNTSIRRDYGKYFTLNIVLINNSNREMTFNPSLITAYKTKKTKMEALTVLGADEYGDRVDRGQKWGAFFNALGQTMAASEAGYSASATQVNTQYGGVSATTVSYNGGAAYQAQLIASDRIANYNWQLLNERKTKDEGYLKTTTVNPGESISGYVNVKYEKGDNLSVNIPIDSVVYPFVWDISK
jgi:hypothetical protein